MINIDDIADSIRPRHVIFKNPQGEDIKLCEEIFIARDITSLRDREKYLCNIIEAEERMPVCKFINVTSLKYTIGLTIKPRKGQPSGHELQDIMSTPNPFEFLNLIHAAKRRSLALIEQCKMELKYTDDLHTIELILESYMSIDGKYQKQSYLLNFGNFTGHYFNKNEFSQVLQAIVKASDAQPLHLPRQPIATNKFHKLSKVNNRVSSFESTLDQRQLKQIFDLVVEIGLFKKPFTVLDLTNLLENSLTVPISVNNNRDLTALFDCLYQEKYICKNWQSVINKYRCLIGPTGAVITSKNLSATKTNISTKSDNFKKINKIIEKLSITMIKS